MKKIKPIEKYFFISEIKGQTSVLWQDFEQKENDEQMSYDDIC